MKPPFLIAATLAIVFVAIWLLRAKSIRESFRAGEASSEQPATLRYLDQYDFQDHYRNQPDSWPVTSTTTTATYTLRRDRPNSYSASAAEATEAAAGVCGACC